jgi:hypothetical protein
VHGTGSSTVPSTTCAAACVVAAAGGPSAAAAWGWGCYEFYSDLVALAQALDVRGLRERALAESLVYHDSLLRTCLRPAPAPPADAAPQASSSTEAGGAPASASVKGTAAVAASVTDSDGDDDVVFVGTTASRPTAAGAGKGGGNKTKKGSKKGKKQQGLDDGVWAQYGIAPRTEVDPYADVIAAVHAPFDGRAALAVQVR